MIRHHRKFIRLVVALGLYFFLSSSFSQEKKIVLRVADHLPANHFLMAPLVKYWMDSVTNGSGGSVTFEYYPAEQLGKAKDMLTLALSGVTDIAGIVPSYMSDKLPLSVVAELPGSFKTSCAGTFAYYPMVMEGGIIASKEYAPIGFRPLLAIVLPPYQVFSKQKVDSIRSFEGLKIQAAGGAKEIMVRKVRAVPIRMAAPELHEALSRGTIDGGMLGTGSIISYNLIGPAKFVTRGENFGSVVAIWGISETGWKKLPDRIQKLMLDAGKSASHNMCAVIDHAVESDYEKMKQGGMTVVSFPPTDHKEVVSLATVVQTEWKDALDKRGKPGSEVLKAFGDALAAGGDSSRR